MEVEEIQRGCSPSILSDRIFDKAALAAKYDLQLVAGTFFQVSKIIIWRGAPTTFWIYTAFWL